MLLNRSKSITKSLKANNMRLFAPFVTFVAFVLAKDHMTLPLTPATAFTTLSLVGLLSNPFNTLLRTIPQLKSALACFSRIQKFLESPSRQPHVLPLSLPATSDLIAGYRTPQHTSRELTADDSIELENLTAQKGSSSLRPIIEVQDASFAWTADGHPTISNVSFSILRTQFTFIIGPVGCGKSTLLKGLLSETLSSKGFVYSRASRCSFVDQTPWIQNITIRQNIIGPSIQEEDWYQQVVQACDLDHDIAAMPNSHGTLSQASNLNRYSDFGDRHSCW